MSPRVPVQRPPKPARSGGSRRVHHGGGHARAVCGALLSRSDWVDDWAAVTCAVCLWRHVWQRQRAPLDATALEPFRHTGRKP